MKEAGNNFNNMMASKQQHLQTRPAYTFHENQVRRSCQQAGLDKEQTLKVLQNLHNGEGR